MGGEGARATHLCHRGREAILEIHTPGPDEMDRVLAAYADLEGELLSREGRGSAALVRFPHCACCRAGQIIPTFESAGGLFLPPSRYGPEGETYQFLFSDSSLSSEVVEGLPDDVEVVHLGT
ncbi:MAG: hypothetical protein ACE5LS_04195, partial [Thermoplasmata archaeon]